MVFGRHQVPPDPARQCEQRLTFVNVATPSISHCVAGWPLRSARIDVNADRPITAKESHMDGAPKFIQKKPSIWLITAALIVSATQLRPSLGALVGIIIQAALLFLARYFAMMEKED
jgi:hypothetical protein